VERISILAITKNGIKIALKIKEFYPSWNVFAPEKFSDDNSSITWFSESTSSKIEDWFYITKCGNVFLFSSIYFQCGFTLVAHPTSVDGVLLM